MHEYRLRNASQSYEKMRQASAASDTVATLHEAEPLSRQQRYVEALEQLSAEYEETTAAWAEKAAEIERAVRQLPPKLGELLRLRYIDGLKWEQVNERLYISPTTSKRLHHAALKKMGLE